jgi:hypothetical protein
MITLDRPVFKLYSAPVTSQNIFSTMYMYTYLFVMLVPRLPARVPVLQYMFDSMGYMNTARVIMIYGVHVYC